MRFNRQHRYNVPYGHKNDRFSNAYITKIVDQFEHVQGKSPKAIGSSRPCAMRMR